MSKQQLKTKLFVFGLGNQQIDSSRYTSPEFELVLGPTDEEHKYLMSKYKYYKKSFDSKKYSFCSDVGRLFKLSQEKGLYVDASVKIGPNVEEFLRKVRNYDVAVFRGNYKYIESGVMGSGCDNNKFYSELLNEFCSYESIATFVMPVFLSKKIFQSGIGFGWDNEVKNKIAAFPLTEIRDKTTIGKTTGGSGTIKQKNFDYFSEVDKNDGGSNGEKMYRNKEIEKGEGNRNVEKALAGDYLDMYRLRMYFDEGLQGVTRKELRQDYISYKQKNFMVNFWDRLVWSQIYVAFTFKWIR